MTAPEDSEFVIPGGVGTISAVIVLGVDTPIGVAILRDLGRNGYRTIGIGQSKGSIGFASRHCHERQVRAKDEAALVEQVLKLTDRYSDAALIAISENDNLLVNRYRDRLEKRLHVLAPPQEMLVQVLDKSRCIALAESVGIRVPDTFEPRSLEEIEQRAGTLSYPRVIKWADPNEVVLELESAGLSCVKCLYAHDPDDLIEKLRPYAAIKRFPLVQEYCPGRGIGQMFLAREGDILLQFQHERLHEWPPEGGVSSLCKSLPLDVHSECRERSMALLQKLRWTGAAMVEYRYDETNNTYYFMEINGRFWGSLPLAMAAGVPFAAGLVSSAGANPVLPGQPDYPTLYCRFMIPEIRRLVRLLVQPGKIQDPFFNYNRLREACNFVASFFRPRTHYYLFSCSDPGPFLADIRNILAKLVRRGD